MSYQDILASDVGSLFNSNDLTIFDTRDANSYSQGHLDGALPISDQEIKSLIVRNQRKNPILVYCYHGNSSRDICSLLCGIGFTQVYNLEGGWLAWQQLKLPVYT